MRAFAFILPALVLLTAAPALAASPEADVTGGRLVGARKDTVAVFNGIPFAAPPVGDLRWRPPQPVAPWEGTRDASSFGPICRQATSGGNNAFLELMLDRLGLSWWRRTMIDAAILFTWPPEQSEDCLTLNVRTRNRGNPEPWPVMVWIHGGGHQSGSGAGATYNTNVLLEHEIVLITINYRLGVFGYFAHPALSAESEHGSSGNYGTLDQIAALEWVRDNAREFGGDPDNVTIFGESAGGHSIGQLMASPLARGLFHRAIPESGTGFPQFLHLRASVLSVPAAEQMGERLAERLAVADDANPARALRALDADAILDAVSGLPEVLPAYHPNVDGWLLPKTTVEIFQAGEQAPVPLIVGSNADEGTLLYPFFKVPIAEAGPVETVTDWEAALEVGYGEQAGVVAASYPVSSEANLLAAGEQLWGDAYFGMPAALMARFHAAAEQPAYLYFFTRKPPSASQTAGSYHASEIPFVLGTSFGAFPRNDYDAGLGAAMQGYWSRFAHHGDPNEAGAVPWPRFDLEDSRLLDLGPEIRASPIERAGRYAAHERYLTRWINAAREARGEGRQETEVSRSD